MIKKLIASILVVFSLLCVVGVSACSCDGEPAPIEVGFNQVRTVNCNEKYDPKIVLSEDAEIIKIELIAPNGEKIELGENYTFTPEFFGRYVYYIDVENGDQQKQFVFDVTSIDGTLPVVTTMPTDKTVGIGIYSRFNDDVLEAVVEDDNVEALKYLTRKVIKVEYNGQIVVENASGISYCLLKDVGEYTITVAFEDVAGNVVYSTYKITTTDTTKPSINALDTYYVWLQDGKASIPQITAYDLAGCTTTFSVKDASNGDVTVQNDRFTASVDETYSLTITAQDTNGNTSTATSSVKVIEYGVIVDGANEDFAQLFVAKKGLVEYQATGGISFINNYSGDTIEWTKGYSYDYDNSFNKLQLTIETYNQNQGSILVSAIDGEQKVFVGKIQLKNANGSSTQATYELDITKAGISNIDGWELEYTSDVQDSKFVVKSMKFMSFSPDDIQIPTGLVTTAQTNQPIELGTPTVTGAQVSQTYINIYNVNSGAVLVAGNLPVESVYTFTQAGSYKIEYVADCGSKIISASQNITVSGEYGATISFAGVFAGGRVGSTYTLPTETVTGGNVTITVKDGADGNVTLNNRSFTPTTAGVYTATYKVGSIQLGSYKFAIENTNVVDFETTNSFNLKTRFNGGFDKNVNGNYVASGLRSARIDLPANKFVGGLFVAPYTLSGNVNHVKLNVFASSQGSIKLSLFVGDNNTEYVSNIFDLKAGNNEISFFIDKINPALGFENLKLTGIVVHNLEKYNNVCFIDNLRFTNATTMSDVEVFKPTAQDKLYIDRQAFVVPNVIVASDTLIKEISVTFGGNGITDIPVTVGALVDIFNDGENEVPANDNGYKLTYTVTDIFDNQHVLEKPVAVRPLTLKGALVLKEYSAGQTISLPDPTLESEKYVLADEDVLVEKYYRNLGAEKWIKANSQGEITFEKSGYVEIQYLVTVGEDKITLTATSYIHEKGVFFDFESYADGAHYGEGVLDAGQMSTVQVVSNWSHDGEYSIYWSNLRGDYESAGFIYGVHNADSEDEKIENGIYYGPYNSTYKIGNFNLRMDNDQKYELGEEVNAVVFWAKSNKETERQRIHFDNYDWKESVGEFTLKEGVHKYVVPLYHNTNSIREPMTSTQLAPFSSFKRVWIELSQNIGFWMDSISFVKLPEIEYQNMEGQQLLYNDGVTLERPEILKYSEIAYDKTQVDNAIAYAIISDGTNTQRVDLKQDTKITLPALQNYKIVYYVQIADNLFNSQEMYFSVNNFDIQFQTPPIVFESGVRTPVLFPIGSETGLTHSLFYRKGDGAWIEITDKDQTKGYVTLTEQGKYQLKFVAEKDGRADQSIFNVLVRTEDVIADFEITEDGKYHGTYYGELGFTNIGHITRDWAYDGNWSYFITGAITHDFMRIDYGKTSDSNDNDYRPLAKSYNAITMYVNAVIPVTNMILEIEYQRGRWLQSNPVNVPTGESKLTFVFNQEFDKIYAFGTSVHYLTNVDGTVCKMYMDCIKAENLGEIYEPNIAETAYTDRQFTFNGCTAVEPIISQTVKYKYAGDADYTVITANANEYSFTPTTVGKIEIVIEVTMDYGARTFTYTVDVVDSATDPSAPDLGWAGPK